MSSHYSALKATLARGWNTWNTRSVLSHVLLPEAFAINLGIRHHLNGVYLKEGLFGKNGKDEEHVRPGPHATDGSYTELSLEWQGVNLRVQSATEDDDLIVLVTPGGEHQAAPLVVVESGILWNRPGSLRRDQEPDRFAGQRSSTVPLSVADICLVRRLRPYHDGVP